MLNSPRVVIIIIRYIIQLLCTSDSLSFSANSELADGIIVSVAFPGDDGGKDEALDPFNEALQSSFARISIRCCCCLQCLNPKHRSRKSSTDRLFR